MDDRDTLSGPDSRLRAAGLSLVPLVLGALVAAGFVALRPAEPPSADPGAFGFAGELRAATVETAADLPCSFDPAETCHRVVFSLSDGGVVSEELLLLPSTPRLRPGDGVFLSYDPDAPADLRYQFADRDRRAVLVTLGVAFGLAVVALGRLRGLAALGGLAASVGVIVLFVVPAILSGRSPALVAAVGAGAIGLLALYLAHGFTDLTHVAALGTFTSLALTVGLAAVAVPAARLTGFVGEESLLLPLVADIDVSGLLLAGIVLGALGALDDVTVTQASTVWELRRAHPAISRPELVAAGLRVGRDHIASTVNTLLLAYAGAAMPLLLLFGFSGLDLGLVANSEVVATEIVRTLVGSIGLVAAVPLTTWLAAAVARAPSS